MRSPFGAARWAALLTIVLANSTDAALAARLADESRPGRVIEGRVSRLESRLDPAGVPVTDVVLEPSGDRFTILGGYRDGLLWVCEEEERFTVGESVRVRLGEGPRGVRPAAVWRGSDDPTAVETSPDGLRPLDEVSGVAPRVLSITPSSGPAAADADIEIEITGTGFGSLGQGSVFFPGLFTLVQATVLSWSDTRIRCLVPRPGIWNDPQVLGGPVKVWTPFGGWSDGDPYIGGAEYHVLFQYAGDRFRDERLPIRYAINPAGWPWPADRVHEIIGAAASRWNGVATGYGRLEAFGETGQPPGPKKDGTNTIGWTEPWPHSDGWLAVTWSGIDSLTGERRESDVEVNGDRDWSIGELTPPGFFDLQTTMTHEFGHWLRLGHVQEKGHVMLPFQNEAEQRRVLGIGEVQGATWIYPKYGEVHASAESVFFGGAEPASLELDVRLFDRRGRPLPGVPAEDVRAMVEWTDGPDGSLGTEDATSAPGVTLPADAPTDAEGRTRFTITRARGSGQVKLTVRSPHGALYERPVVYVSDADPSQPRPALALTAPWPNPSRGGAVRATARLGTASSRLLARIFDARGRIAAVLHDGPAEGDVMLSWSLAEERRPAAGLYFLRVESGSSIETRKLVVFAP